MKVFKIYTSTFLLVVLCLIPLDIFSQNEDIKVEFSFQPPNEFVCHIQNTSKYPVTIILNKEEGEGHSTLLFDIEDIRGDTIQNLFYGLMKDPNDQSQILRLDSGQIYTVSYIEYFPQRFVKATVNIKYGVKSPLPGPVAFYEKTFDLDEIRKKGNLTALTQDVYLSLEYPEKKIRLTDIAIWSSYGHIGIVTSVDGDNVTVISGNSLNQVMYGTIPKSGLSEHCKILKI